MVAIEKMLDRLFYSDTAKEMSNSETLLYILLLWMSQKQNPVFVSYKDIQEYAGISNVTITRGIRKMQKLGMIKKIHQKPGEPCGYLVEEVRL